MIEERKVVSADDLQKVQEISLSVPAKDSMSKELSARKPASEKFILDATAGFRMMWFNKHHPNCIYLDQRPECEPDIIGDFRNLKDFPNKTFKLVIWDPPHTINKNGITTISHQRYFGGLEPETWQEDLKKGFAEIWRVLADFGVLNLKWSTLNIPSNKLLELFPVKPMVYQISANHERKEQGKRIRKDVTLWFCFMKIPEEVKP